MFFIPSFICASTKEISLKLYLKASKNRVVLVFDERFKSDKYTVRVAETIHEACKLVEAGFERVTEMDGCKIFRNRK